ncbi:2'-5' RNA ligase family protein [Clostridium sp. CF012]|uniref:2'-5' RNA ligase family protein n=1 Tax=Clostridium sp. CF012 TaxID=2843319 RepID=UPI001C0E08A7|nr:2'-5' RNA ligase family protein [Clostridium sp. CF012]MBU3144537.1 2'-5' RNA ligase family protein [Clostridium sp. CF012]
MYAVELFLNEQSDLYVRSIWDELSHEHIDSSLKDIKEICPHIALSVYEDIDIVDFTEEFLVFKANFKPINTCFDILGVFPVTGTCFLKPTVTEELLNIHSKFHEQFRAFNEKSNSYYLPGHWNPHCTLAIGLSAEELKGVFNFSLDRFKPLRITLNDVGLVKIDFKDGKCVSSIRIG